MKTTFNLSLILVVTGLCLSPVTNAQRTQLQEADLHYSQMEYYQALPLYEGLANNTKTESSEVIRRSAFCARAINDYTKAEDWYAKVVHLKDATPEETYAYAQVLRTHQKYDASDTWMTKYHAMNPNSKMAQNYYKAVGNWQAYMKDSARYAVSAMSHLNTAELDFSPIIAGDVLYFASSRKSKALFNKSNDQDGSYFTKVYHVSMKDINNQQPESTGLSSDSKYHIGPVSVSEDGNTMYITKSYKREKGKDGRVISTLELMTATRQKDGSYGDYQSFPYNSPSYSIGQATISNDGNVLYFTSDMPGSLGATDIWRCQRNGQTWSAPENMGALINTEGQEMSPVAQPDGSLTFASEGLGGLGGLDIYRCRPDGKGGFLPPENMGYPVNTSYDDFGLYIDKTGTLGYFSSNRPGGKGLDDLYQVKIHNVYVTVEGYVLSKATQAPIPNINVYLMDPDGRVIDSALTNSTGFYTRSTDPRRLSALKANDPNGVYKTEAPSIALDLPTDAKEIRKNIYMDKPETATAAPKATDGASDKATFQTIYYNFDKSDLRPESIKNLDELYNWLSQHPSTKIRVNSFADCRGTDAYNQKLSERRSQSVVDFLLKKGIQKNRIIAKSLGESKPVNSCVCQQVDQKGCSEEEHEKNRRSEVEFMK